MSTHETAPPSEQGNQPKKGCCGGPAPKGTAACCVKDAEAKASGQSGCGCGCSAATKRRG